MGVLCDNPRIGASAAGTYEIDRSLRFNSADNAGLSRTFGTVSEFDNKKWTVSFWTKRTKLGVHGPLFGYGTAASVFKVVRAVSIFDCSMVTTLPLVS